MKNSNNRLRATPILLLTCLVWGLAFVFQIKSSESIPPLIFNGLRFTVGALSMIPVAFLFEKQKKPVSVEAPEMHGATHSVKAILRYGFISGTFLCIASGLQQYGCTFTQSAGLSGFLCGIYPLLTPLASFVAFRRKPSAGVFFGLFLAIGGLSLLTLFGLSSSGNTGTGTDWMWLGIPLLIGAAFFFAMQMVSVDYAVERVNCLWFSFAQFAVCAVLSLLLGLAFEYNGITIAGKQAITAFTWRGVFEGIDGILYCGICSVGIGYTLQTVGQKMTDANYAAVIFNAEAVFAAIGGVLFGTDHINVIGYVGCALILSGIVLSEMLPVRSGADRPAP